VLNVEVGNGFRVSVKKCIQMKKMNATSSVIRDRRGLTPVIKA